MKLTRSAECALRSGRDEADRGRKERVFCDGDEQLFCHLVIFPVIVSCFTDILSEKSLLARRLNNAHIERAVRLTSTEPYSVK